jgi:hypothetical protein
MKSADIFASLLLAGGVTTFVQTVDPTTLTQIAQLIVSIIMSVAGLINIFKKPKQ